MLRIIILTPCALDQNKPTYNELQSINLQQNELILKLKEEISSLHKPYLGEENYYKDRFYRITENVNDVVYRLSLPDCHYEYISPQARNLFGYIPEEFYKSPLIIRRLIHPDFFKYFISNWRKLSSGKAPEFYEIKIIRKDGEIRWVQQKNLIIRDPSNVAIAIEGIVTDITRRKLSEEALIQSEAQKKAILNNLPHLAWMKDCEGKYVSVNESFANSVNRTVDKIIGKNDYDLYPENYAQKYRQEDLKIILTRKQLYVEEETNEKWFETFKAPIFDAIGNVIGITGISLEISHRKKTEEELKNYSEKLAIQNIKLKLINDELKASKEKAEESDKLKSSFLANMSHEIRTPMNAILGFSTLIRNRVLPEIKRKEYIDLINSNCRQLLHIISDIIDISKIESGQISIFNKNFQLNKLINELYLSYKNQIENLNKPIAIVISCGLTDDESSVYTDKVRLEQVLSNLLSNAMKFTEEGKIEIGYYIDRRRDIIFYVRDSGIGMTEDEQQVIFDRFRQVGSSYNKLYGGTGLGLSISKGLTEKLGGKIWLESKVEAGSTFFISIPYKPGVRVMQMPTIEYHTEYNWKGKTVLIAEDEEVNYNLLETILNPTKVKIIWVRNGSDAVKACLNQNTKIDLILMDIKMSEMNGLEATKIIKNSRKEIPIIAQTAYAMSTDEDNCLRAGCDDYISKPLKIDDLLKKIGRFLKEDNLTVRNTDATKIAN